MDDHQSRKRRRHSRQDESTPRYAAERRKPAQPADIGCGSPARRKEGDAAETRVRYHMKAAENKYVYNWLTKVATEQQTQTQSPAYGPPLFLFQTRGFRDPSPERCDETVPEERIHREKRRDSSDSSLVQPAYGREELLLRETTIGQVTSEDQTTHISKKAKKHKQPASSTTDGTQSESDQPQRKETFDKGSRHKTKEDRYEFKKTRQHVAEDDKPAKKKTIKVKRGDAAKASRKAGEDLINGFRSKNVAQDRLTVRPGTGIFKNGRASSPSRSRGLPDLAFSEMQFLKQSSKQPAESEKGVIISKSGQKTKRERERARNEISNYFIPVQLPLQETGINRGREVSMLPSDAGKTEATSFIRGHHSHPPLSPERGQRNDRVLYEAFSMRRPSPQKFSFPKPKLDQIFVPRNTTASGKSTSYCTWSESVRSPSVRVKTMVADASWNQRLGVSPTSCQRIPIAGIYKEVGIQAELGSDVGLPYNLAARKSHRDTEDTQVVASKQRKAINTLSAHGMKDQNHTEDHDEDRIDQFQADRAMLHDCEPHRDCAWPGKDRSMDRVESHTKISVDSNQAADYANQTTTEQCTQTGMDAVGRTNSSVLPSQTNLDSEVQDIMSRAVLAQKAYINRRSTPKAAGEDRGGNSNVRDRATGEPNARDSGAQEENNGSLEIELTDQHRENGASALFSGLADGRRNENASHPGQHHSLIPMHESDLPGFGPAQTEYSHGAGYQPNELDDNGFCITGERDLRQVENIATPEHIEQPQLMIPTRGFSTGAAHIAAAQPRTISPMEIMEPIYARQLQKQALEAQEEQNGLHNPQEQGQGAIYLYEGGQWEREQLNAEIPQEYNPNEAEDGQVNYGDKYEWQQDGLDLIDDSMYYEEEQLFDPEAQVHDAAPADNMLFYTQASAPSAGYQWIPRQQSYFNAAAGQMPQLGSWEKVQTAVVPQELTMQFWQPRRGY